jgi:hypothetical protein
MNLHRLVVLIDAGSFRNGWPDLLALLSKRLDGSSYLDEARLPGQEHIIDDEGHAPVAQRLLVLPLLISSQRAAFGCEPIVDMKTGFFRLLMRQRQGSRFSYAL